MNDLVGTWVLVASEDRMIAMYEAVAMNFNENGELRYRMKVGNNWQEIQMTYQVDSTGSFIRTTQPSAPGVEVTAFRFEGEELVLSFDGSDSRFARADE